MKINPKIVKNGVIKHLTLKLKAAVIQAIDVSSPDISLPMLNNR